MKPPKKLIEVALPLDAINAAASREKSIRHGHPSTLHLWWARRPLAAARAVLFAQLVNDPGGERGWGAYKGQTKEEAQRERDRLHDIIRDLVKWENTNNEAVLERARAEIRRSWRETCKITGDDPDKLPPFYDPFAGGGAIPLEAQRLGLEAHASDLNPVAVLINKAMIEIPGRFAGKPPIGPLPAGERQTKVQGTDDWSGARGLAEDVRRYGAWMREEAFRRIGHLYPQVDLPKAHGGGKATVIAWLWTRTVPCPNPACGCQMPLVRSFDLSTKKGKRVWVVPEIDRSVSPPRVRFSVKSGDGEGRPGTVNRGGGRCICCDAPVPFKYIRAEAKAKRMSEQLMAVVAEGHRQRIYVRPTPEIEEVARQVAPTWQPTGEISHWPGRTNVVEYGLTTFGDLFTPRQLVALTTFSDLVGEARARVIADAKRAGWPDDGVGLAGGGCCATAYGDAVGVYLAFAVDKCTDYWNSIATWAQSGGFIRNCFSRQAIPMTWDFVEGNPFSFSTANWSAAFEWVSRSIRELPSYGRASVIQLDSSAQTEAKVRLISTDPPYYDNIGYADLSDFFYVWLRRSLRRIYPDLFATMLVPKAEELVATPYRHGGKEAAESFFLEGMKKAISNMAKASHPAFPATIYYAFKQAETKGGGTASTGWETFLAAVLEAGFAITGTWPMRTERGARSVGIGTNSLASSIILVCRPRPADAPTVSRKQFLRELEEQLPDALEAMIGGAEGASPIAPVDLAQAAIGPGMGSSPSRRRSSKRTGRRCRSTRRSP